ncbi:serine/threonine-protein kinase [Streptomyces sp. NPDC005355]|uniref:serine/threonine-protein kinase n=1 Tax=Streptomyces sp. NPDC005355 TaxID=3157038 RepID=UPI0033B89F46
MTNDGGRANEPTSYGLRPPHGPAAAPVPAPTPAPPPQARHDGYEPTQYAAQHDPRSGHTPHPPEPPQAPQGTQPPQGTQTVPGTGRLIGGRYRLVSRLGHGGMGTVWRAHDQIVDREVAVKEPRVPDNLPERERQTAYQRMEREARAAARIDHPSVVTVHDVVVEDGRPWIVMELVHGHSLGDRLAEGTLDSREAARIGLAVLGALSAAHEAGVLHRDVKPDNVLLGRNDRVVLTDFGIAQIEGEQGLTETGGFVGSPEFIAPERVLGQRPGPASDLWSLGVVLYAAVEGMSPFRRSHTPATLQAVLAAEPQTPARGAGALGTLIMQLLRKDPAMRPVAAEVRQTLESAVTPPQAVPTMVGTRAYGQSESQNRFVPPVLHKNRKAQFALGAVVLVVAAALVLGLMKPFASESPLPSGWTVREERDLLGASLAVPENYKRVQKDDDASNPAVTFYDPSGVYTISLVASTSDERRTITNARGAAEQVVEYYKSGAQATMEEAKSGARKKGEQQGQDAVDFDTAFFEYGTSSDTNRIRYMNRDHITVSGKKIAWQLTVTMPAQGDARKTGDELYDNVLKNVKVEENFTIGTD